MDLLLLLDCLFFFAARVDVAELRVELAFLDVVVRLLTDFAAFLLVVLLAAFLLAAFLLLRVERLDAGLAARGA